MTTLEPRGQFEMPVDCQSADQRELALEASLPDRPLLLMPLAIPALDGHA